MAIMAERDAAIQERNLALDERKRAFAERDIAMLQRDAALAERNSAMQQRDDAIATLRFQTTTTNTTFLISPTTSEPLPSPQGQNRHFTTLDQDLHHMFDLPEDDNNDTTYQVDVPEPHNPKPKGAKMPKAGRRRVESVKLKQEEWKDQLGLNRVSFDESAMPVPVCSCTGVPQPCYRWGSGGWQSACCTTTMSMYPLPQVSNKKYSRVGGRKMSGGAFSKLLTRLASEGYDLSTPLDLKEHWAKHGTNRYSTVK